MRILDGLLPRCKIFNRLNLEFRNSEKYSKHPYLACDSAEEALRKYYRMRAPRTLTGVSSSPAALPIKKPFPRILEGQTSMSTLTSWQSSDLAANHVSSLSERARKINFHKMHKFQEAGLEHDELTAVVDQLAELADCYRESDAL